MTDLGILVRANASVLAETGGRIFGLDVQLLFDILFSGIAVFILFIFLSYVLFEPVKKVLNDRQEKIKNDIENAAKDKEEAETLKKEYDARVKNAENEASEIVSAARKKAIKNESMIVAEAKEEATRIITRANQEAELEKSRVKDEVKREIVEVATAMAGKFVDASLDDDQQTKLIDDTLEEMGDCTWQSK